MINVQIEGNEKRLSDASESWIREQIGRRQRDGLKVCVRVSVKIGSVDIALSSGGCQSFGRGSRLPTSKETQICNRWNDLKLNEAQIDIGCLIKFLKQVESLC